MDLNCTVFRTAQCRRAESKKLNSMGIYTAKDLLTHFPREYNDRSNICKIKRFGIK